MREQLRENSATAQDAAMRFDNLLNEFVEVLDNIAVVAAIDVRGIGRRYFTKGHIDISRAELANSNHLFQIGSQSKTFVAIAMLLLHRAKRIDLDARVRHHIDIPVDGRISLRHLLMNTCGLGEYTFAMPLTRLDPRIPLTPRDLVALALPQGQLFEPGTRFDYCNTGWTIAAMVIESVCGKAYGEVIHELVLTPLGLKCTSFGGAAPLHRMIHGYIESSATSGRVDIAGCNAWAYGAGDGISGLDDMLDLFSSLSRNDSPIGISISDINSVTAKPARSPYFPLSVGAEYGLGIERRAWAGSEVWGHPGSTGGYMSGTWTDARRGVTVTTCVTRVAAIPPGADSDIRYPRAQLFAMALSTAYLLANDLAKSG